MRDFKSFSVASLKAKGKEPGRVEAIISVFGNVDRGGDRVVLGAFEEAGLPPWVWSHQWHIPPIGKSLDADELPPGHKLLPDKIKDLGGWWVDGQLFLDDSGIAGQYAKSVHTGFLEEALKEFSFAYEVPEGGSRTITEEDRVSDDHDRDLLKMAVYEVGPTLVGMNDSTALLNVASFGMWNPANTGEIKGAIGPHSTETTGGSWDGPAAVRGMPNESRVLRYCHAWVDSAGDPNAKISYKFPHHRTMGGPAVLNGVRNALARLPGSSIPDGDKSGVERHLRRHLEAAEESGLLEAEGKSGGQVLTDEELETRAIRAREILLDFPR